MKVRLRTSAYLDRWYPSGAEVEIPDDHFEAALHDDLTPTPEPEPETPKESE